MSIARLDISTVPGDIVSSRFKQMFAVINNNFSSTTNNYTNINQISYAGTVAPKFISVESTGRMYRYIASGSGYTVDDDYVLNTPDGGDTRYVSIDYDLNAKVNNIDGSSSSDKVTIVGNITDCVSICDSTYKFVCVYSTGRVYKYVTSGSTYAVDNDYVLNTKDGGVTRFVSIDYDILLELTALGDEVTKTVHIFDDADAVADFSGSSNAIISVASTGMGYKYVASGASFIIDGMDILATLDGGDTRYVSIVYSISQEIDSINTTLDLKAPIASPTFTGTVSGITSAMVGLGNVDNTSDVNKPVSTATQTALDLKANINNPTFTGTVGGITKSMVGLGNVDNTSDIDKPISTAIQTALDLKANINNPTFTGTVSGITKSMVGLGNVDNTSDIDKPISTATQTALDLKANINNPTFTGIVSGITSAMVGLGNVDNTSDINKPVSTATQTELDLKAPIANPTFTGNVSGITKSMVGLGNVDNTSDINKPVSIAAQTELDLKAPIASPTFTGTVSGITSAMVGLGNVDNTSDVNKPVSTATQTALDLKAPIASPTFTGNVNIDTGYGNNVQVGMETFGIAYNNTGSDIFNGTPIKLTTWNSTYNCPNMVVAKSSSLDLSEWDGILTADALASSTSPAPYTVFGICHDIPAATLSEGDVVYIAPNGGLTNVKPIAPNYIRRVGNIQNKRVNIADLYVGASFSNIDTEQIFIETGEPNGFPNKFAVGVSYDYATRTVTVSGTFHFYNKAVRHIKTSVSETVTHANTTGTYYAYYNDSTLTISNVPPDLSIYTPVSEVYYNNTVATTFWTGANGIMICTRHGVVMDWANQECWKKYIGASADSGFVMTGTYLVATGTGTLSDNTFGIDAGVVRDADNLSSVSQLADNNGVGNVYNVWYKSGNQWLWYTNNVPYLYANDNILYNQIVVDNGLLTEVSVNGGYVCMYVVAIPSLTSGFGINIIMGQTLHTDINGAESESIYGVDLTLFPFNVIAPIYKVIYRREDAYADTGNCRIESMEKLIGSKLILGVSGVVQSIHNSMSGRSNASCHPASAIDNTPSQYVTSATQQLVNDELGLKVFNMPSTIGVITGNMTGIRGTRPNITMAGDVLTVTPVVDFDVYIKGTRFAKTAVETLTVADVEGFHFVYYDTSGVLAESLTASDTFITEYAPIAVLYWDFTNKIAITLADEPHDVSRDRLIHRYLHSYLGTGYAGGLAITGITIGDGSLDSHLHLSVGNGTIYDEDSPVIITNNSPQQLVTLNAPVFYLSGTSWRMDNASTLPYKSFVGGSGRLAYNSVVGGVGSQVECADNTFVNYYFLATNDINYPVCAIQGRANYTSVSHATQNILNGVNNFVGITLPFPEYTPIGAVAVKTSSSFTNSKKAAIVTNMDGDDHKDLRVNYKTNKYSSDVAWNGKRIIVSDVKGDFRTVKEAVDWFNVFATSNVLIHVDPGVYDVTDTITINNPSYVCTISGDGSYISTLNAATGLTNKPMISCVTRTIITKFNFNGSTLASYGTLSTESFINITSAIHVEIIDIIASGFYNGIKLSAQGSKVWVFNSNVENCTANGIVTAGGNVDMCSCNLTNNTTALYIDSGTSLSIEVKSSKFTVNSTQTGIRYDGADVTYVLLSVIGNDFIGSGTYAAGFDYTIARDADIRILSNTGLIDNTPKAYIQFKNNATATTCTGRSTYYKAAGTNTISSTRKFTIANNRVTYLPSISRNLTVMITGNVSAAGNNRTVSIGIYKNGNTLVEETELLCATSGSNYTFALNTEIDVVANNDYFEVWVACLSAPNINVTVRDLQFIIKS